jgi:hypothetical protein
MAAHCLSQIAAANPPSGSTGPNLIEQTRNAISDMRDAGANPTLLVLNGSDAANLDLTVQPGTGDYIFATGTAGGASPLWSVRVIEVAGATDPILIDPVLLGVLYTGQVLFAADPYSGFRKNTTEFRVEGPALLHIRSALGAFNIAES